MKASVFCRPFFWGRVCRRSKKRATPSAGLQVQGLCGLGNTVRPHCQPRQHGRNPLTLPCEASQPGLFPADLQRSTEGHSTCGLFAWTGHAADSPSSVLVPRWSLRTAHDLPPTGALVARLTLHQLSTMWTTNPAFRGRFLIVRRLVAVHGLSVVLNHNRDLNHNLKRR